ncbi:MAG: Omp28-related outer membrane protein [Bacteroidota bacterium]
MKTILILIAALLVLEVHAQQQSVLVEVFTNSHCGVCPPAHATLNSYSMGANGAYVQFIYYHMLFPYPSDPLAQANTTDPAARNQYYGPFGATPVAFFDGALQSNSYSTWTTKLNNRVAIARPLVITLSGSSITNGLSVTATLAATATIPETDLKVFFTLVENSTYVGNNGVSPQNYVLRKMINGSGGEAFAIANGQTVVLTKQVTFTNVSDPTRAGVVVFVQSAGTKSVVQSQYIPYGMLTSIQPGEEQPSAFRLHQNFPNPFNPSTEISFTLPTQSFVSLKIFNLLGEEVATIVSDELQAGNYSRQWTPEGLSSGVYFYRLKAGSFSETRKLALLK